MLPPPRAPLFRLLERLGVALILVAALVPRLRDFTAPLDREFEGWQGAFFTIAAINYERLGFTRTLGLPVLNVDLGARDDAEHRLWDRPQSWFVYTNHPPTVALVAWAGLKAFAPEGWNEAWREGRGPEGFEPALRLPFVVVHVLGLVALWWAARRAYGARVALIALALGAACPPSVLYATLANYEGPAILCVLLAAGCFTGFLRDGKRADLVLFALCMAAGLAVTWAPLFFLPAFVLHALLARTPLRALALAVAGSLASLAPIALHALASGIVGGLPGRAQATLAGRARELLAPLLDGSRPLGEWAGLQLARTLSWCTPGVVIFAAVGLVLSCTRAAGGRVRLAPTLLLGSCLYLLAFYRHTLEPQHTFLLFPALGVVLCAAVALDAASPLLLRLRAGHAPLVLAVFTLALLCILRFNALRHEFRGDAAGPPPVGAVAPRWPLPPETAAEFRALVPPGSFSVYPSASGLNLAPSLYAWRTQLPVSGPQDPALRAASLLGLAHAPRFLLLPKEPLPVEREACAALRALASERVPLESARWEVWRLP
jgi:hypothetical protein